MTYHEPFVIHGTHRLDGEGIVAAADSYRRRLEVLRDA
jgi:hypothetical protein